ncbi:MAG TPA: endolytic transglycosylase MltG [Balneolaceae bacterium]|nr:endolytic transglycosylase MltG [Balneolaceae bacterium]
MKEKFQIPFSTDELILGLLLCFLTAFLVAESRWSRLNNHQAISSRHPVNIYLDHPTDLKELTDVLADSDLITSKPEFRWAANLLGWHKFPEGHYLVDHGYTYDDFLSKLAKGIQDPVSVTILPGRTKGEIISSIAHQLEFDSLSLAKTLQDSEFLASNNLTPKDVIGRLYPNTYSLYWTSSPKAIFKRILQEFHKAVISANKQRFKKIHKSVDDIVTMASIIEWEAKVDSEKATISGLYWNRLNKGMRLQADPTINYVIGERRRLLYEDYKIKDPYNTYLHRGLPPGPITNPSLSSINAALYPENNNYLYMVASPDGSHAFSKTFEEHKRKSEKWRKWLQKQYRLKRQHEKQSKE